MPLHHCLQSGVHREPGAICRLPLRPLQPYAPILENFLDTLGPGDAEGQDQDEEFQSQ